MSNKLLKKGQIIPLIYDKMFKKVFGNPDNTEPIKYLIECILKEKIKQVSLLPQDIIGDSKNNKKNTVDVMAILEDGRKIIVEANTNFDVGIRRRNLRYMSRVMSQELDEGDPYTEYHEHYLINLNLEGSNKYPVLCYTYKTEHADIEAEYYEYSKDLTIYCVNIPYFTRKCYNGDGNKLDEQEMFLAMMNCREYEKTEQFMGVNRVMKDIIKKVREFSADEIMALAYNEEEHDRYIKEIRDHDFENKLKSKEKAFKERMKIKKKEMDKWIKQSQEKLEKSKEEIKQSQEELEKSQEELEKSQEELEKSQEELKKTNELIKYQQAKLFNKAKQLGLSDIDILNIFKT